MCNDGDEFLQAGVEVIQLELISRLCGTPTPGVWPSVIKLPLWHTLKPKKIHRRRVREEFSLMPAPALDLLDKMLELDPDRRITAEEALKSTWLKNVVPEQYVSILYSFGLMLSLRWFKFPQFHYTMYSFLVLILFFFNVGIFHS